MRHAWDWSTHWLPLLAALFPLIERLDISHNAHALITDYSELQWLKKCATI